jgi:transcriptional regulator with XRE-family HTH domain
MRAASRKKTRPRPSKSQVADSMPAPPIAGPAGHEVVSFGVRLRELRKRMGWTLQQASEVTGVPIATLSRIANEKVSPTLDIVMRIARGFKMSPSDFIFSPSKPLAERTISVARAGQGRFAEIPNLIYHPLHAAGGPNSPAAVLVTTFCRRPEEYGPLTSHPGEEFLYVLDGTLEVLFEGGVAHTLEPGDSLLFHSDIRHGYISKGARQAKFLIVTVSPNGEFDFGVREDDSATRGGARR